MVIALKSQRETFSDTVKNPSLSSRSRRVPWVLRLDSQRLKALFADSSRIPSGLTSNDAMVRKVSEGIKLPSKRENAIGVLYLFVTALCWSFVAVVVKQLTATVDSNTISFFRVFLATLVFVALFVWQKGDWRRLAWFAPLILVGALGRAGNYLLYNAGLVYTPASAATILAPAQQIGVVILAGWFLREQIATKWLGMVLSLLGLLLIWWNGQPLSTLVAPDYAWGYTLLILAGFATAFQFVSQKALSGSFTGVEILLPTFVTATLITVPFAWSSGGFSRSYDLQTWALLLVLGLVLTGIAFVFMAEGFKRCDSSSGVVIVNTGVFFTLFWSYVLLHEDVGPMMIVGACLGLVGAIAVIRTDRNEIDRLSNPTDSPTYEVKRT